MPDPAPHPPADELASQLSFVGALAGGAANVILQLSFPPVAWGVLESTVESGQVTRHPLKRARTTFTYLAVAALGTDAQRARFRAALDGVHARVRSGAGSPVRYDALDPELQLWVAACLYRGTDDVLRALGRPLGGDRADALYRTAARYATTLQVPAERWPADRAAFAAYWAEMMAGNRLDPPVRRYLRDLVDLRHLPAPLRLLAPANRLLTAGFLPEELRRAMGYGWGPGRQARFERVVRRLGAVEERLPGHLRTLPWRALLRDADRRAAAGRPLL